MLLALAVAVLGQRKISNVNVLFPAVYSPLRHPQTLLHAYGGCYIWSSSNPALLTLEQFPDQDLPDCKNSTMLKLKHQGEYPGLLSVQALDKLSGVKMKVDVRVAQLQRIQIFTKFKVMHAGVVQMIFLVGFDREGNAMSSLEGLHFSWNIENTRVINSIRIKDSEIKTSQIRKSIESEGGQSDVLFIRGVRTGQSKISVVCKEAQYTHITTSTNIKVFEKFTLSPDGIIYLMPGSRIKFSVLQDYKTVSMPNSNYEVQVGQPFSVTDGLLLQSPQRTGEGKLRVTDIRSKGEYYEQVKLIVQSPSQIKINFPEYAVVGKAYNISSAAFSGSNVLAGDFQILIEGIQINKDSTALCLSHGTHELTASLGQFFKDSKKIKCVLPLLNVGPSSVRLPVEGIYSVPVIGGTQSYHFRVQPSELASVIDNKITGKRLGKGKIIVSDRLAPDNQIAIPLEILQVGRVYPVQQIVEMEVGQKNVVYLVADATDGKPFSNISLKLDQKYSAVCHSILNNSYSGLVSQLADSQLLPYLQDRLLKLTPVPKEYIQAYSESQIKKIQNNLQNYGISSRIELTANQHGTASFKPQNYAVSSLPFEVRVLQSIQLRDQMQRTVLLAPGSSITSAVKGGPYSKHTQLKNYKILANKCSERDQACLRKAYFQAKASAQGQELRFECNNEQQGRREVQYFAANQRERNLLRPLVMQVRGTIECKQPQQLQIKILGQENNPNIKLEKGNAYSATLQAFDTLKNRFYNFSSLLPLWKSSESTFQPVGQRERQGLKGVTESDILQKFKIGQSDSGQINVQLGKNKNVKASLNYDAVNRLKSSSLSQPIFFDKNNLKKIDMAGGTGKIKVKAADPSLVDVYFDPLENKVNIRPLQPGQTDLLIQDEGVLNGEPIKLKYKAQSPGQMLLTLNNSLLEVGQAVEVEVLVLDSQGKPFPPSEYESMNIQIIDSNADLQDSLSVQKTSQFNKFLLKPNARGLYNIGAKTYSNGKRIITESFKACEAFQPLAVSVQKDLILGTGCLALIQVTGGPDSSSNVQFEFSHQGDGAVQIKELSGRNFELRGSKEGKSKLNFKIKREGEVISKTQILINVVDIGSVKISGSISPERRVHKKAQIRLLPQLYHQGQLMAQAQCPFKYTWKVGSEEILQISRGKSDMGVNVTALQIGSTFIQLQVTEQVKNKSIGSSRSLIRVIPRVDLEIPSYIGQPSFKGSTLLLPPKSSYFFEPGTDIQVPCNRGLKVQGNRIELDEGRSSGTIKLTDLFGNQEFINVASANIFSLFIQNGGDQVTVQADSQTLLKFYLQDVHGRLIPNQIPQLKYQIKMSDPKIADAQVTDSLQFIRLRSKQPGTSTLTVTLEGSPHVYDTVQLLVGSMINPQSPALHVGSKTKFTTSKKGKGTWKSSDSRIVQVDNEGTVSALEQGSAFIEYSDSMSYKTRVTVWGADTIELAKGPSGTLTNYKRSSGYMPVYVFQFKVFSSLSGQVIKEFSPKGQGALHFKCESNSPLNFDVETNIKEMANGQHMPICTVTARQNTNAKAKELVLIVSTYSQQSSFKLQKKFEYKFSWELQPKVLKVQMNRDPHRLAIQSNHPLQVTPSRQLQGWVTHQYNYNDAEEVIRIVPQGDYPVQGKILINDPHTQQTFSIPVDYDPQGDSFTEQLPERSSQWRGWRVQWADLLVVLLVGGLVYMACTGAFSREHHLKIK